MNQVNNLETTIELNNDTIIYLLKSVSSTLNEVRNKAEAIFLSNKYSLDLYKSLLFIYSSIEDKNVKLQAILVLKNLVRLELSSAKSQFRGLNHITELSPEFKEILNYLKGSLISILRSNQYSSSEKSHFKELIILISDKCFPHDWKEINVIFFEFFQIPESNVNPNNLQVIFDLSELFFAVIKQHNKKRIIASRNKFKDYKNEYLDKFEGFYKKIHHFFFTKTISHELLVKSLVLLDKILLVLIDCSFTDLYKEKNIVKLLQLSLEKGEYLLNLILERQMGNDNFDHLYQKNLYSIIKYLSKIQSSAPILFFQDFSKFVLILTKILQNMNSFEEYVVKIAIYALYKILTTQVYRDNIVDNNEIVITREDPISNTTPTKSKLKSQSVKGIAALISPTKYKNYENELIDASKQFNDFFNENSIRGLLDLSLSLIPNYFKSRHQDEPDININDHDEDTIPFEPYSENTLDWTLIHRYLLKTIFENYTSLSIKYLVQNLEIIYKNANYLNYTLIESLVNFANLVPSLYRDQIISETNMSLIDYRKIISFLQNSTQNEEVLRLCVSTITKWSDLLISNETIFEYLNYLMHFLTTSNNKIILVEICLSLKIIINNIDKHLKESKAFAVFDDKEKLQSNLKNKINWGECLQVVSSVGLNLFSTEINPDILLQLINLFTILIQKCHYQCNGDILHAIEKSSLVQIVLQTNHEFGTNALIDMWKALLLSFQSSQVIIKYTLDYITLSFVKEVDVNNLNLLLFLLRVVELTPINSSDNKNKEITSPQEISSHILNFLRVNIKVLQSNYTQYLNNIVINILEEIVLFDVLTNEDIQMIFSICENRFMPTIDLSFSMLSKTTPNLNEYALSDLCDYKASIVSLMNTVLIVYYQNKGLNQILPLFNKFLSLLLNDFILTINQNPGFNSFYTSHMISLMNRVILLDFNFMNQLINEFIQSNLNKNITFDSILSEWFKKMESSVSQENRKLNCLVIVNFLRLMNKDQFIRFFNQISNVSLYTIYNLSIVKLQDQSNSFELSSVKIGGLYKNINIRSSSRKIQIYEGDTILNQDIHELYKNTLENCMLNHQISYDFLIGNLVKNPANERRLNEIFGRISSAEQFLEA